MNLNNVLRSQKAEIPAPILASLTDKELEFLNGFLGELAAGAEKTAKYRDVLTAVKAYLPLSDKSRTAIFNTLNERKTGATLTAGAIEEGIYKTGGNVYYTPEKVILVNGSGKVDVIKNTIIPDPVPQGVRPGMNALQALLSYFVVIKKGVIKAAVPLSSISKRFYQERMAINPSGIITLISALNDFSKYVPVLEKAVRKQETVSAERLVGLFKDLLKTIPSNMYCYLHALVVYEFLNIYNKVGEKFSLRSRVMYQKKVIVPDAAFKLVTPEDGVQGMGKEELEQIKSRGYPSLAVYLGGVELSIKVPKVEGIATAIAARQLSSQTRGSDKTALSVMSSMWGYSGVTSRMVRTAQRAIAMVGGVIRSGCSMIDVEMSSVGHVPVLFHSLTHHFPSDNWRFHVFANQLSKIDPRYRDRVITERRDGSHFLRYEKSDIGSHTIKDKGNNEVVVEVSKESYQSESSGWKPHGSYSGYTIYTALYGYFPWAKKGLNPGKSKFFGPLPSPDKEHFVYGFGMSDQFYGIVSTITGYSLFGKAVSVVHLDKPPVLKEELVTLKVVSSETEWYNRVVQHNCLREVYWSLAKPLYSAISNVIVVPKSGVTFEENSFGDEWKAVAEDMNYEDFNLVEQDAQDDYLTGEDSNENTEEKDEEDRPGEIADSDHDDDQGDDDPDTEELLQEEQEDLNSPLPLLSSQQGSSSEYVSTTASLVNPSRINVKKQSKSSSSSQKRDKETGLKYVGSPVDLFAND